MTRILFSILFLPSFLIAQHTITGVFNPPESYNVAILYKVNPTISDYVANTKINKESGSFKFELDSTATKGIYRIVYALPQEDYNFDIIYNGNEDIELKFNPETGVKYQKSHENKLLASYTNSMSMVTQSISNFYRKRSTDTTALSTIFKTQKETQQKFESLSEGTIANHFIRANRPFTPKKPVDPETYVSLLKKHYFDHVDFNNPMLQSSTFLEERMLNYVFGMASNASNEIEAYKKHISSFNKKIENVSLEVKRNLLSLLWEQMADLKLEEVANYIAENYLMDIAVELNDQELLHALILYKDTSIGNVAPDFQWDTKDGKSQKKLSELSTAEIYVLAFWSTTCSHCLDDIPQLHEFVNTLNDKVKVIAIALEDEPYKWNTLTHELSSFLNIYGNDKWDNTIALSYGVTSTPTFIVLDKNKTIVAKPNDIEELKALIAEN